MGGPPAARALFALMTRPARKLLMLGWDAADWTMIRPLIAKGGMPNLRALLKDAASADLATLEPRLSPMLWTSVATGKTADKHGVLNFLEPAPDAHAGAPALRPVASTTRTTRALWNVAHLAGLRTVAVSWYASHPAEPVRGAVVSNLLSEAQPARAAAPWPLAPGAIHPASLAERVAAVRVHPDRVPDRVMARLVPQHAKLRDDPRLATLRRLVAQCLSVHAAAKELMQAEPDWDLAMVFHEAIDTIGHHFMQFFPPRMKHVSQRDADLFARVMPGVYALHDELLGEMLRLAGPDAAVMLLSDHGFHNADRRPVTTGLSKEARAATEALWHREHGVLVLRGPGVTPNATVHAPTLLDVAPTALALLGLPAGRDMDGRVLAEALAAPAPDRIDSWDDAPGDDGRHPADMRQDPFEAHDAVRQLVDLGYMAALPEAAEAQVELARRESAFNLGAALLGCGRATRAAEVLAPLVESHPDEPRYALALARALATVARFDEAERALSVVRSRDPANRDAALLLVSVLAGAGRTGDARAALEPLATDPTTPPLALSDLYAALEMWDESAQAAERAGSGDESAKALAIARAEIARGRFEPGAERCLDVLETRPAHPEANHLLGVALAWLGEAADAVRAFETVLTVQPGRIEAHRFLAALHRRAGDAAGADACDRRAEAILDEQAPDPARRALAERQSARGPDAWLAAHPAERTA